MYRGLSNIAVSFIIVLVLLSIILSINNLINTSLSLYNYMIVALNRKSRILSEGAYLLVRNDSLYIKALPGCPIRYLILSNNTNIRIFSINNTSIRINSMLLSYLSDNKSRFFIVTCNGNIVEMNSLYVYNGIYNILKNQNWFSSDSIRFYVFQPGNREFIDPTICTFVFHRYHNGYGYINANFSYDIFCYNGSGLVSDPFILYLYNRFLVKPNNNIADALAFVSGSLIVNPIRETISVHLLSRFYDLFTGSSLANYSTPSILNISAQRAVQAVSLVNNSTAYLYAWPRFSSVSFSGKFLVALPGYIRSRNLTTNITKVDGGMYISDGARIATPSTSETVNFNISLSLHNNTFYILEKIPINLSVSYYITNNSYVFTLNTSNITLPPKKMNITNIVLIYNEKIYEDNYISVILRKVWLYRAFGVPSVSLLLEVISKRQVLSVLAYETEKYVNISISPSFPDVYIKPVVIQKYLDGKLLGLYSSTSVLVKAYYPVNYGLLRVQLFRLTMPYIVVVSK